MVSAGVMAAAGFFFWILCSHLYTPAQVGIATSIISACSLVSGFAMLGFTNVLIRFLPTSQRKSQQISTALIVTGIASIITAAIFLTWAFVTHNQSVQTHNVALLVGTFILYVLISSANNVLESSFIAYRSTKYVLFKNIILSILKLLLPLVFFSLGFLGIIDAITLATVFAWIVGIIWLYKYFNFRPSFTIDSAAVKETYLFAAGNYAGSLFGILPGTVLPLIVLSRLGAQEAAFFYMPMMIVTLLNVIPSASAQSLFAEASHDEKNLIKHLTNAAKNLLLLLVPAVVVIWIISPFILRVFGAAYAINGTEALQILALASLVGGLNYFGDTLLNIKKNVSLYIFMNALNALIIVILAYYMAPRGLIAVAEAILIGQIITVIAYLSINWRLIGEFWVETHT